MEDGIELNFAPPGSTPSAALARRQTIAKKGGRWTDRLKARKSVRRAVNNESCFDTSTLAVAASPVKTPAAIHRGRMSPSAATAVVVRHSNHASRLETSKLKPDASASSHTIIQPRAPLASSSDLSLDPTPPRIPARLSRPSGPKSPKAPQIISSLFTSNPTAQQIKKASILTKSHAPSNAPLTGDTSTFEGLGLDPLLQRHLRGKMKIDRPTGIQRSALPYMLSSSLDTDLSFKPGTIDSSPGVRDVFIQSQTGSGKTLAYLLPIIQSLLPLSRLSYIDRSIGTLAIVLAPTRELAQQISKVLEQILSMSLSAEDDDKHLTRWLVPGLLTGGSTKTHEKARLRKGVPILVSTPGRMLDHLQNTASFNCGKTLFFVLDEADRLMDLGFERTVADILKALDGRRKIQIAAEDHTEDQGGGMMRWPFWARGRQTVLCSATVDAKIQRLAGMALKDPIIFSDTRVTLVEERNRRTSEEMSLQDASAIKFPSASPDKFTPPSQLTQKYICTPIKLRLVTLVALLRSLTGSAPGTKVIVFLSSTDAVDFHWSLLGGVQMSDLVERSHQEEPKGEDAKEEVGQDGHRVELKISAPKSTQDDTVSLKSPLFPSTTIHRLHGSLPLRTRMSSLVAFSAASSKPSVLLATSVASRGLDLPLVSAVVQYDLPTEGGANEYVHRVGRTARAGQGGEAWAFVAPSEMEWVGWVQGKMGAVPEKGVQLSQVGVVDVLKQGFGGKGYEYEGRATDVQMSFERWVLAADQNAALARRAFSSFVRAYSTHPLEEKQFFHPKSLHLGHLAKSFALREAPGDLVSWSKSSQLPSTQTAKRKRRDVDEDEEPQLGNSAKARTETERKMYAAVRKAGRATKSGGAMGEFNGSKRMPRAVDTKAAGEFQVVGSGELERMVGRPTTLARS